MENSSPSFCSGPASAQPSGIFSDVSSVRPTLRTYLKLQPISSPSQFLILLPLQSFSFFHTNHNHLSYCLIYLLFYDLYFLLSFFPSWNKSSSKTMLCLFCQWCIPSTQKNILVCSRPSINMCGRNECWFYVYYVMETMCCLRGMAYASSHPARI